MINDKHPTLISNFDLGPRRPLHVCLFACSLPEPRDAVCVSANPNLTLVLVFLPSHAEPRPCCRPPCLSSVFHPCCQSIGSFPYPARLPCPTWPLHPSFYGRSPTDHPHHIGRCQSINDRCHMELMAPCKLPPGLDLVAIWKGYCCIWTDSGYFHMFFLSPFDLDLSLHSIPAGFTLVSSRHHSRHHSPPLLSSRLTLCKIQPFSKISRFSDTAAHCP